MIKPLEIYLLFFNSKKLANYKNEKTKFLSHFFLISQYLRNNYDTFLKILKDVMPKKLGKDKSWMMNIIFNFGKNNRYYSIVSIFPSKVIKQETKEIKIGLIQK